MLQPSFLHLLEIESMLIRRTLLSAFPKNGSRNV